MKCPLCKTTDLLMTERRSIEIDYCPQCRGVWLDRGELDKLIAQDVADADAPSSARAGRDERRDREHAHDNERSRGYDDHRTGYRAHKKKRSIFDMFDFD
ncbi:zf-TFIIB domain-containing protein [Paraburkholderia sp. RL18-103-BIB-C]|jgi:Zn-finger nucleic acid-binding protein|uniref:TFIIB-type zinc ribbon-containing protein n=1 Tax=unclassified Paraburkholderia TaxID=2615204 RepID=UPI002F51F2CB